MRSTRTTSLILSVGLGAVALAGCTATAPSGATPSGDGASPPAAPSATESLAPNPEASEPYTVPDTAEGEIARAVFERYPADGEVPTGSSVIFDAVAAPFAVEGQCVGTRARWQVITASTDAPAAELAAGTLVCDGRQLAQGVFDVGEIGAVQIQFVDATDADSAWVRMVPAS
jgi:hypothetical protein